MYHAKLAAYATTTFTTLAIPHDRPAHLQHHAYSSLLMLQGAGGYLCVPSLLADLSLRREEKLVWRRRQCVADAEGTPTAPLVPFVPPPPGPPPQRPPAGQPADQPGRTRGGGNGPPPGPPGRAGVGAGAGAGGAGPATVWRAAHDSSFLLLSRDVVELVRVGGSKGLSHAVLDRWVRLRALHQLDLLHQLHQPTNPPTSPTQPNPPTHHPTNRKVAV